MRLLAVDDEPSILELLTAFLEAEGDNDIAAALSGQEALALIEAAEKPFDCILLDIQMPEMNGITLCESIRAIPGYFDVPIIMLTAMSQKSYIEKAFSVGATDYVTKPFDFLELRCRLRAAAKIAYECGRATEAVDTARRVILDAGNENKPHIDEALSIEDVERAVGYSAFENYILVMSRAKLIFATIFAVKIVDFEAIHKAVNTRALRGILKNVAEAAVGIAPDSANLISYRGSGIFLCFKLRKSAHSHTPSVLRVAMSAPNRSSFAPQRPDVMAVIGEEVSLVSISKTGVLVALHKAVDLVGHEYLPAVRLAEMARAKRAHPKEADEKSNTTRQAYELVLQDIIKEETARAGSLGGSKFR